MKLINKLVFFILFPAVCLAISDKYPGEKNINDIINSKSKILNFQIERISIGDSLLNFFSNNEINNFSKLQYPNNKKFFQLSVKTNDYEFLSEKYDELQFFVKKNDFKYNVYAVNGLKYFKNNHEKCLQFKNQILRDVKIVTKGLKENSHRSYYPIEDRKSYADVNDFYFNEGHTLRLWCVNWAKKTEKKRGFIDHFAISLTSSTVLDFVNSSLQSMQ